MGVRTTENGRVKSFLLEPGLPASLEKVCFLFATKRALLRHSLASMCVERNKLLDCLSSASADDI